MLEVLDNVLTGTRVPQKTGVNNGIMQEATISRLTGS